MKTNTWRKNHTSQTVIASWFTPFWPCCAYIDTNLEEPLNLTNAPPCSKDTSFSCSYSYSLSPISLSTFPRTETSWLQQPPMLGTQQQRFPMKKTRAPHEIPGNTQMIFWRKQARKGRKMEFFWRKVWRVRIQSDEEAWKGDEKIMHRE